MDVAVPLKESASAAEPRVGTSSGVLRLIGKGLALVLIVCAFVLGIVFLVPEGNDYALATLKKHQRLELDVPQKIVFIGGSNLAFGLDSPAIERATGAAVVNMGMNGFFGPRYMLAEVKESLRRPDIAVISFEPDGFFKSVDGTPSELFPVVKANPRAFSYLTLQQRVAVLKSVPYIAQQKLLRLMREGIDLGTRAVNPAAESATRRATEDELLSTVGRLSGFNDQGDELNHLGVKWPYKHGDELNISALAVDPEIVGLLQEFTREMSARGVTVFISYSPVAQAYYDRHKQALQNLHRLLSSSPPLVVPSPPEAFVYRDAWFFDTVFHLTAESRPLRTRKVIDDLELFRTRATAK